MVDAWSSKHTTLTISSEKMLIDILKTTMSSDRHFGSDMSSDGLKVLALCILMGQVQPMILSDCQMGCDRCKKQT